MPKNEAVKLGHLNSANILVRVNDAPKTCIRFLVFREVHITNSHLSLKASLHILLAASHAQDKMALREVRRRLIRLALRYESMLQAAN